MSSTNHNKKTILLLNDTIKINIKKNTIHLTHNKIHLQIGHPKQTHTNFVTTINKTSQLKTILQTMHKNYLPTKQIDKYINILHHTITLYPSHNKKHLKLNNITLKQKHLSKTHQNFEKYIQHNEKNTFEITTQL